jgi:hypothetical protein
MVREMRALKYLRSIVGRFKIRFVVVQIPELACGESLEVGVGFLIGEWGVNGHSGTRGVKDEGGGMKDEIKKGEERRGKSEKRKRGMSWDVEN